MHFSFSPVSVVLAAITINVDPVAVVSILVPLSVVAFSVGPCVDTFSLLLVLEEPSLVLALISSVDFHALPMFQVIDPVPAVFFSRLLFLENSFAVELVVAESALVNIS